MTDKRKVRTVARFGDPRVDAQMREVVKQANRAIDDLISAEEALAGHTEDYANPHQVTAAQVGAPTKAEFEAHEALNVPLGDTAHGITADMLGGGGGGGTPFVYYEVWAWPCGQVSTGTEKGFGCKFLPMLDCKILGAIVKTDWEAGKVYKLAVKALDHSLLVEAEYVPATSGTAQWREILFLTPAQLSRLDESYCDFWRADGSNTAKYYDPYDATAFIRRTGSYRGTSDNQAAATNSYGVFLKVQAG